MTSYPTPTPGPQQSYPPSSYHAPPNNGMGIAGFVVSLVGLIICGGFLCPVGLVLSLIGLGKEPRGFAIAGTVIGLIGSAIAALFVLAFMGVFGAGLAFSNWFSGQFQTITTMSIASSDIDTYYSNNNNTLPDAATGTSLLTGYTDEWGTPIEYRPIQGSTTDYELISAGPDMTIGTNDDIAQQYTAFGFGFTQPATPGSPLGQSAPNEQQISYAYEQAAAALREAFPVGSDLPTAAEGTAAIVKVRDAWGQPFQYSPTNNPPLYHLKSAGPDRVWGSDDDPDPRSFFFEPTGSP